MSSLIRKDYELRSDRRVWIVDRCSGRFAMFSTGRIDLERLFPLAVLEIHYRSGYPLTQCKRVVNPIWQMETGSAKS